MLIDNCTERLIQGVLRHGPDILEHCQTSDDLSQYINRLHKEHLQYPVPQKHVDTTHWFIPETYRTMNIEKHLIDQCPKENHDRLMSELVMFRQHDMIPMLRTMKYIVDTLRANNIVWGVGRGSSVASYVLHIIGVHKIDPIKYSIPIEEFFKEKKNG